ncbi:MAG: DUF2142 domain-containing protein [Saprospiraceae bacterium]|nr:DUF2142 domain-containing protein [Saprospiraceae bacterium]MCB9319243.1 DUF2142 domain-containing protein [Lewinellaceae bacterium]
MNGVSNKSFGNQPSTLFVLLSIVFGIILVFLIPPFQNPDEPAHTYRAYHLASGHLFGIQENGRSGGMVPAWIVKLDSTTRYLRNKPDAKYTNHNVTPKPATHLRFADFPNVSYYSPIAYLPFALIAKLLLLTGINGLPAIHILRLIGLLIWILAGLYLMKAFPEAGDLPLVTGLLPGTIALVSAITPDSITLVLVLLWLITIFKKTKTNWIPALLLALLFTVQRPNWWPLTWVVFLITGTLWTRWQKWIMVLFPLTGTLLFLMVVQGTFITYNDYNPAFRNGVQLNPGVNPLIQLRLVTHDLMFFLHTLLDTWMDIWGSIFRHLMGKFGWGTNYISWVSTFLLVVTLIWSGITNKIYLHRLEKLFLAWMGVSVIVITSLILYLQWNEVGASYIHGINGRYLLPVLPIFLVAIPWRYAAISKQTMLIGLILLITGIDLIMQVYIRYYLL